MEDLYIQKQVLLEHRCLYVDGVLLHQGVPDTSASEFYKDLYHILGVNYLKFFKMDMLSKTLFIASEALIKNKALMAEANPHGEPLTQADAHVAMALYNSHSSLETDRQFQHSIKSGAFFPSPSLFVYTLPNVALGEVAIRNRFMGENCTFIAPEFDAERCVEYVNILINRKMYSHVVCGWFDFVDERGEAKLYLVSKDKMDKIFNINNL